jgi:hypothetical protein
VDDLDRVNGAVENKWGALAHDFVADIAARSTRLPDVPRRLALSGGDRGHPLRVRLVRRAHDIAGREQGHGKSIYMTIPAVQDFHRAGAAAGSFYVTGGTLPPTPPPTWCARRTGTCSPGLLAGEYCYVLNTRQMGKVQPDDPHAAGCGAGRGRRRAGPDRVGQNLTPEQWYDGLLVSLGEQLHLEDELDDFWQDHTGIGPMQRFFAALGQVVLPALGERRLALFVDEIDAVRSLPFSADEFFAGIRSATTAGRRSGLGAPCLLSPGGGHPGGPDLRHADEPLQHRAPDRARDFTPEEAAPLAQGLGRTGERLLARVCSGRAGTPT